MTDSPREPGSATEIRAAVAAGVPEIAAMTPGRTGNLSARSGDLMAITPSGVPYGEIDPAAVPVLTLDGEPVAGDLAPSSETPMHRGIYRSLDVEAIAHVHSPWATTLAVLGEELPPVHYMVAAASGPVPVAPYEPFGTAELAEAAVSSMESAGTTACLLANHGLVAGGEDVTDAIETAVAVESTARVYLQARAVGDPIELSPEEFAEAKAQFDSYGQPDSAGGD
ncbi:MAG: class II aldolase/adducin family protein [Halodesulfurarchaeum sp.]